MHKTTWDQIEQKKPATQFNIKNSLMFWQLSLSYILPLIVSLLMGIIIISYTKNNLLAQACSTNKLQLENAMQMIENSIHAINDLSASLSNSANSETQLFLNMPASNKGKLTYTIQNTMKALLPLQDTNKLIDGYFLYSRINHALIAPNQGFISADMYYDKYFYYADITYKEWEENILNTRYYKKILSPRPFVYGGSENNTILYVDSIYNSTGKNVGQAVFRINANKIQELMAPAISVESSNMYIMDESGNVLLSYYNDPQLEKSIHYDKTQTSSNFEQTINGIKYFISCFVSKDTGWAYMITVPYSALFQQSINILKTIIYSLIISYGIVLIIALASFRINRKPLVSMANSLSAEKISPDKLIKHGVNCLNIAVNKIVSDNVQMEKQMDEQKYFIKNMILFELEAGEIKNADDINRVGSCLNLSITDKFFYGAYLLIRNVEKVSDLRSPTVRYQEILQSLSSYKENVSLVAPKERNVFVFLYQQNKEEADCRDYRNIFRDIYHNLYSTFGLETVICVGPASDNLFQVNQSFEAARSLLNNNANSLFNSKFLLEYNSAAAVETEYYYSIQNEQKLNNLISCYDIEDIHQLLADIYKKNFEQHYLTGLMRKILYSKILGTLIGFAGTVPLSNELKGSLSGMEPLHFFKLIEIHCKQICESLQQKNEKNNMQSLEEIRKYINRNYCNCDLSLSYIALKFDLSESNLSIHIKEHLGQTFTAYVEELRLKKANMLLIDGQLSIAEIAEQVGYLSPHSFRRAYKRYYGTCPSQFKNIEIEP